VIRFKLYLLGLLLLGSTGVWGQSKAELQRQRDAITAQLATTERLLGATRENRTNAVSQLRLVENRIALREELIRHHRQELRSIERRMAGTDSEIRSLEGHIAALRDEYARMVAQAYRMRLSQNPMLYLFAAESFSQAALRYQLLQSYSKLRKNQVEAIESYQKELSVTRAALDSERLETQRVLEDIAAERDRLAGDRSERERLVNQLKGEENRLRSEQQKAEQERQRLNAEISRLIEAELAAERASSSGEFALTPAGRVVSEAFERNQSTLPWPVTRGVITTRFGRQNHPTLPGITFDNNGIDLATDPGASVQAIFDGKISSVFPIPGSGTTIILSHGAYRTVYSNLNEVTLAKGTEVTRGTTLGKSRAVDGSATVHFEIWHIEGTTKRPVDPANWIVRN
jgi:septal ring factor EnvC (AmiA/AmiB activator)